MDEKIMYILSNHEIIKCGIDDNFLTKKGDRRSFY
jgi:hypothetical protein